MKRALLGTWVRAGRRAGRERRTTFMTTGNKAKNAAESAKGKLKQAHGKVVGDPALEAEGKGIQAKSDVKQAGEKAKDAVADATDTKAKDKAPRVKADAKKAVKKVKAAAKH
jgi:uncharacterized protein YjbJ (UPF0337 family)